jgi:hypothetical protein
MKANLKKTMAFFIAAILLASAVPAFSQSTTGLSGSLESTRQTHFYKDPTHAFMVAFFPGFLVHGYGHFYAKDKMVGTALLGGEILSLSSMVVGALMQDDPEHFTGGIFGGNRNVNTTGRRMVIFGGVGFAVTWFADMLHAPTAAKDYNDRYDLKPAASLDKGYPTLALAYRF